MLRSVWGLVAVAGLGLTIATSASALADEAADRAAPPAAEAAAATAAATPSEAPLPSCLDQSIKDELGQTLRPRGVQKRDFAKRGHVELIGRGGLYAGDLTSSSWIAGGALGFWFTEDLGIELGFEVTPIALDLDSPLAEFFGDDRFEKGLGYLPLANLVWSPIHTKMKMGGDIVHGDFLVFAGGGRLIHDSVQGASFDAGVALELFTTKVLTVRFEARDVIAVQEAAAETRLTNNLVASFALGLWIPTPL
ncbi:MAG: outer membrane beta-barrel domain-containing protein [Myxococcales bacterium]|nr:outer membrane beta-barrel domain-containing protein [Myxococcales bacterium]MBP6845136.1 outer membrane beta-barrel domain-containing protein [Kofleriaceae bacterium]